MLDNSKNTSQIIEIHAIISGTVQSVGFRATTLFFASNLGIKGNVKNLSNGSVEIYAQGTKIILDQLIDKLNKLFRITNIKKRIYNPEVMYTGFYIDY